MTPAPEIVPDTEHRGLLGVLPAAWRPYALLARFDRPIGWWLLFWPGAWAVAFSGQALHRWDLILWLLVGSIAMRGAGCVYNDIVDRDLDRQVARTRSRPVARGAVSLKAAWAWLLALCLVGLVVLLQLHRTAQIVALASLVLVAAYPFMKRITWWPQAWLGLVFSWAGLVGWAEAGAENFGWLPGLFLYAGSIFWVIGYDTIYAIQDIEDDALVGVRSSARALGARIRGGVAFCYFTALFLWSGALLIFAPVIGPDPLLFALLLPAALHFLWQVVTLDPADGANALARFRSNRFAGLTVFLAFLTLGMLARI